MTRATELLKTKGQADEARRLCGQGIAFGKDRVREHPRDVEIRMHLAGLEDRLGWIEDTQGRLPEALALFHSSVDTLSTTPLDFQGE